MDIINETTGNKITIPYISRHTPFFEKYENIILESIDLLKENDSDIVNINSFHAYETGILEVIFYKEEKYIFEPVFNLYLHTGVFKHEYNSIEVVFKHNDYKLTIFKKHGKL